MLLDIDVAQRQGYTVLTPHGEIDFATGPNLQEAITDRLLSGDVHLVVDLSDVEFIESTGLGALVGGRRRAKDVNGSLALVIADPEVLKVFSITGLDTVFTIDDTVESATATPVERGEGGWPTPQTDRRRR